MHMSAQSSAQPVSVTGTEARRELGVCRNPQKSRCGGGER